MRALFIGRFQPLHEGHVKVIKWLVDSGYDVVVGLGSANSSFTYRNPFTVGERMDMILETVGRVVMCSIPDTGGQSLLWYPLVRQHCPRFDEVYSNDDYTRISMEQWGISVKPTPLFDRNELSGSRIRYMMARGDGAWRGLVPSSVAKVIESIGGEERVKRLAIIENILKP